MAKPVDTSAFASLYTSERNSRSNGNSAPGASCVQLTALSFALVFTSEALNAHVLSAVAPEHADVFGTLIDRDCVEALTMFAANGPEQQEHFLQATTINTATGSMQAETSLF